MSSSTSRAWMVAASVGVVEVMKDQAGICRWNYALRSIHQHAKNNLRSYSNQANNRVLVSSSAPAAASSVVHEKIKMMKRDEEEKMKQSEESLRKVMYLSCWGPN